MTNPTHIWGERKDLDALKEHLANAGIQEHQENIIKASAGPFEYYLAFLITTQFAKCVKHWLTMKHQKMITRENFGQRIVITGDQTPEQIAAALGNSHGFNLENIPAGKQVATLSGGPHHGLSVDFDEKSTSLTIQSRVLERNGKWRVYFEAKYNLVAGKKPYVFEFLE